MSRLAKKQYLIAIMDRYQSAGRLEKARILSEFCSVCGYNRKYAIRLLNQPIRVSRERPGRKAVYGLEVKNLLTEFWHALGRICSKRIQAALPEWLPAFEAARGSLPDDIRGLLLAMSPATIDRSIAWAGARKLEQGLECNPTLEVGVPFPHPDSSGGS